MTFKKDDLMLRKNLFLVFAIVGILFSVFMIYWGSRTPTKRSLLFEPPHAPFEHYIAGEGTIETFDQNTDLGVPFPDLIADIFVQTGDAVTKNQPLFKLDTRHLEADLQKAFAELRLAKTEFKNQNEQFTYYEVLCNKNAVSKKEYTQAYYAKTAAYDRVLVAEKRVIEIQTQIERSLIRAPENGDILQSNIRVGEFANVNPFDRKSLMIFGSNTLFQMRVNIAEEDAWRVIPNASARAYVRGNSSIQIPLTFSFIEPYIIPKQTLTGSDLERVDTRVLQIIYTFDKGTNPLYVGQLLDVYIQAKPSKYEAS